MPPPAGAPSCGGSYPPRRGDHTRAPLGKLDDRPIVGTRWYLVGIEAICPQRERAAFAALSRVAGPDMSLATTLQGSAKCSGQPAEAVLATLTFTRTRHSWPAASDALRP